MSEFEKGYENFEDRDATPEQVAEFFERSHKFMEKEGTLIAFKGMELPIFRLDVSSKVMKQMGFDPETQNIRFESEDTREEEGDTFPNSVSFYIDTNEGGLINHVSDSLMEASPDSELPYDYEQQSEYSNTAPEPASEPKPFPSSKQEARIILEKYMDKIVANWPKESRLKLMDDILRAEAKARDAEYPDRPIDL